MLQFCPDVPQLDRAIHAQRQQLLQIGLVDTFDDLCVVCPDKISDLPFGSIQIADAAVDAAHDEILVVIRDKVRAFGVYSYFEEHFAEVFSPYFYTVFAGGHDALCFYGAEC